MAGNDPLEVYGYCDALVRMKHISGRTVHVWLSDTAYIPASTANLISTSMLRKFGVYLDERRGTMVNDKGESMYQLGLAGGLWVAEDMEYPIELDWVHMRVTSEPDLAAAPTSFSSFERKPSKGNRELWHRRLGHAGLTAIDRLEDAARGGELNEDHNDPKHLCARCSLSKFRSVISRRSRSAREEAPLLSTPFAVLHSDLICPTVPAYDKSTVYAHDFCEVTKLHGGKGIASKSEWTEVLKDRVAFLERQYNVSVKRLMTDSDPVLNRQDFVKWLGQTGRVSEKSAPRNPETNGTIEVAGRMITWMGRTLCSDSGLPPSLWPLFYDTAVYILNRLPTKSLKWQTPLGKLYELCGYPGVKPYVDHLRVYGCLAYVYDRTIPTGDKLTPRAWIGWLVGYTASNIWRIWIPALERVVESRDVLFDENIVYRDVPQTASIDGTKIPSPPVSPVEYFNFADNQQPEFVDQGYEPIEPASDDASDPVPIQAHSRPDDNGESRDKVIDIPNDVSHPKEPKRAHRLLIQCLQLSVRL